MRSRPAPSGIDPRFAERVRNLHPQSAELRDFKGTWGSSRYSKHKFAPVSACFGQMLFSLLNLGKGKASKFSRSEKAFVGHFKNGVVLSHHTCLKGPPRPPDSFLSLLFSGLLKLWARFEMCMENPNCETQHRFDGRFLDEMRLSSSQLIVCIQRGAHFAWSSDIATVRRRIST